MSMRASRRGTNSTNFSVTMVTHLISSSVPYVTETGNNLQPPTARLPPSTWRALSYIKKRLRTDCPAPSSLQFCHSSQTDPVTSGNVSKCEGPSDNNETAECGVLHPMFRLPQCCRGENWSTAHYTCEKTQRRRQMTG